VLALTRPSGRPYAGIRTTTSRHEAALADDFGYHTDHHGSLVRPAGLLAVRASGDPQALAAAGEQAVIAAAHMQRRLVLSAVDEVLASADPRATPLARGDGLILVSSPQPPASPQ
jgi:hypothetical protein